MSKNILKLLLFTGILYLSACSSDDEATPQQSELEETISTKTPEEHKTSLERTGLDYVDQVEALRESESVATLTSLANFLSMSGPFDEEPQQVELRSALRFIFDVRDFQENKLTLKELANRRIKESEEPESIQEAFDMLIGTYEWNSTNEDWDYTEGGEIALFKFPSEDGGTTNDAQFAIRKYSGVIVTGNPLNESEDYTGDLPTELVSDLTVGGTKIMEFGFNATYSENGTPTSLSKAITLSPFTLEYTFSNTTAEISTGYSFTSNGENILASNVAVQGQFDVDNIESSIDDENISGFITGGSSNVQIFNILFDANITDIDGLEDAVADIDELAEAESYEDAAALMETTLNKHLDYKIKYAEENQIIANGSIVGVVMEETYYYYEWNESTQSYDEYEGVDTWIEPELILEFGDGSKVSLETYGEEGFDDLITAVEDLLEELGLEDEEDQVEDVREFN